MNSIIIEHGLLLTEILYEACRNILNSDVINIINNGNDALASIKTLQEPTLIIIGTPLPEVNTFHIINQLSASIKHLILVTSRTCSPYIVYNIEHSPAKGFLSTDTASISEINVALSVIAAGGCFFCPLYKSIQSIYRQSRRPFQHFLTDRQMTILEMIGDRLSDSQIAARLHLSERTVESHRINIANKLEIRSKRDLENYAYENGFTQGVTSLGK